jgi:hypothetical protein
MKFEIEGKVLIANQRQVNGPDTCRELDITYLCSMQDADGDFIGNDNIHISLPYNMKFKESALMNMEGKRIKITVELETA